MEEEKKPGLLLQIFGTELALWGFRTETLNPGLLGRWPVMAGATRARFRSLDGQAASLTLRVFRGVLAGLWEDFEPSRYNIVFAAFRFLEDMVQILPVLSGEVEPRGGWAQETQAAQASFVRLLSYRDYHQVLMTDFPAYLEAREHDKETLEAVRRGLGFITGLTLYPPTFKNTIIAHYSLPAGELRRWEKITEGLKVEPANLKVFEAPDNVQKLIFRKIEKLRGEQDEMGTRLKEINEISRRLDRDEAGVMKPTHLEASIDFVLENVSGLVGVDKDPVKWMGKPHRLSFAVMKDIELNFVGLLGAAVRTRDARQTGDVFIFQPTCFKKQNDAFASVMGALQRINRQSGDIEYSYEDYKKFRDTRPDDPLVRYVNDVCGRSLAWMRAMTQRIELILRQHSAARELEKRGEAPATLTATAETPIETFPEEPRFLPFADRLIVARYHLNGKSVTEAFELMLARMYQCRYRFREPELMKQLDSAGHFRDQSTRITEELERMGVRS